MLRRGTGKAGLVGGTGLDGGVGAEGWEGLLRVARREGQYEEGRDGDK